MSILNRIAAFFTQIVTPVYVLRAPIAVTLVGGAALSVLDQTQEVYRAYALDRDNSWPQIASAFATLALAGFVIWFIGRYLTLRWSPDELSASNGSGFLLRWLPRLLGAALPFAASYGLAQGARGLRAIEVPDWLDAQMPATAVSIREAADAYATAGDLLWKASLGSLGIGLFILAFTYLRAFRKRWKYETPNPWLFGRWTRIGFYVLTLGLVIAFSAIFLGARASQGVLAEMLGTFTILNLFIICLAFFSSALTNVYDRTKFPALSLLVVTALLSTGFDLNDNHVIRTSKQEFLPLPNAAKSFRIWLETRPDRDYFRARGQPYPVYIVAAEGGGMYAAQHAALTLARMQDRCPGFAQHIFAISAVSGGGLGSALFSSLVRERATPVRQPTCLFGEQSKGWYEQKSNDFLSRDFLSPLVAAGLFPDFLQRFVPWPVPEFSRARALEASFEQAWAAAVAEAPENPFAESFYSHWRADGVAPALVLNATHVETGARVIAAPFRLNRQSSVRLQNINAIVDSDFALSTAVGIGARFPWILPPASWTRYDGREQYRFADGGYFESSGIDTALDLSNALQDFLRTRRDAGDNSLDIEINLIMLAPDDMLEDPQKSPHALARRAEINKRRGYDELTSPLKALLNARWERGVASAARAFDQFCDDCIRDREDRRTYAGLDGRARIMRLNFTDFELTLGWRLSPITQSLISAHSGHPENCRAARASLREEWPWTARVLNENNCSACQMMYTLTGRRPDLDALAPPIDRPRLASAGELPTWVELCRAEPAAPQAPMYRLPGQESRK